VLGALLSSGLRNRLEISEPVASPQRTTLNPTISITGRWCRLPGRSASRAGASLRPASRLGRARVAYGF
jgi:hypothetical protein